MNRPSDATRPSVATGEAFASYVDTGIRLLDRLDHRGPLRFDADGRVESSIREAFQRTGFYVFTDLLPTTDIDAILHDLDGVLDRLPSHAGSEVDAHGRPAVGVGHPCPEAVYARPLSDPFGGSEILNSRHGTKMAEPAPADGAPRGVPFILQSPLAWMPNFLELYGHPLLLSATESFVGPGFTPYTESIFLKQPGLGASVAWHQDGMTYWGEDGLGPGSHGVNWMVNLHPTTAPNALWLVPGSHTGEKIDLAALAGGGSTELIPGAVPMLVEPGDVAVTDRQIVHGSFANTSPDPRVTLTLSFLPRSAVLNRTNFRGEVFDDARVEYRSRAISYAIDARARHRPDEPRYEYAPMRHFDEPWTPDVAETYFREYGTADIYI